MSTAPPTTMSKIAKEFKVNRSGKDAVLYIGLLDYAHRELAPLSIRTVLIQAPSSANDQTAVIWAEVTCSSGVFTGIGDANIGNVGKMVALHIIRMAETRAKARALRDAANLGGVALEELGPESEEDDSPQPRNERTDRPTPQEPTPIRPNVAPKAGRLHSGLGIELGSYLENHGIEATALPGDGSDAAAYTALLNKWITGITAREDKGSTDPVVVPGKGTRLVNALAAFQKGGVALKMPTAMHKAGANWLLTALEKVLELEAEALGTGNN